MSYYCDKYPITEKRTLSKDTYSVTIYAPEVAKAAHVGQFASLAAAGFTLRRPISICEFSRSKGTVRFVFEVRGKGTEAISRLNVGDNLDVLAPLGNGFEIPDSADRIILAGGGIGVPPLLGIAKKLGEKTKAILGFRDYSRIILADEFRDYGSDVVICTDDGSVGNKGTVTSPLEEAIKTGGADIVCACGPLPMLNAVAKVCAEHDVPCRISMEQRMGCGVGACVVCSCLTIRNGEEHYARVCKDGPVFDAKEVKFNG